MDRNTTLAQERGQEMTREDGNEAIKAVIDMLNPAAAAETSSFVIETSLQLYPEAMRGRPDTPAATSLREYHFTVLMTRLATAYTEGRGQDFADDRFAINNLLQEEPEHQPLAARFRKLMGLWLQEAHNKRQENDEEEDEEEGDMAEDDEDSEQSDGGVAIKTRKASQGSQGSRSSTASAGSRAVSKDGDEVGSSPTAAPAKSVFDLSGLNDTDDDEDDSSSDEE